VTDVKNFDFGARKHAPKSTKSQEPDIPFTLEEGGPVYHMRGEVNDKRVSVLRLLFARASDRGDDKAAAKHTTEMLECLFTPETVDALLARMVDPDDYFNDALFKELMEKAVEVHAGGRPTTSSRTSSGSRRQTGRKSTASSSSKASTSGRSRSTAK
jgi:hypothetical protein